MSLGHAAISAFPWSLGVHISAIPLGDAISNRLDSTAVPVFFIELSCANSLPCSAASRFNRAALTWSVFARQCSSR